MSVTVETSDPISIAVKAAQGFRVLECQECCEKIREALTAAGHHGQLLTLRCARGDFIVCLSYNGGKTAISHNGTDKAVRIRDRIIDNLHPDGLTYEAWIIDFDGIGG